MSDLQLSLLVIGAVVVGAVCIYNWLQERSYRRKISQSFTGAHDDVLLKAGVESAMTDGRLEPQIVSPDATATEAQRASSSAASPEPSDGSDPILDFTAQIDADAPISDGVIDELTS